MQPSDHSNGSVCNQMSAFIYLKAVSHFVFYEYAFYAITYRSREDLFVKGALLWRMIDGFHTGNMVIILR